ncbi:MAG: proton-conducting transporter membrane subunit [Candidatus Limnocylindrales bacterium]|jgi:NADH:ubiquinone oxidoreductase subunit 2 (subunit N)
MTLVAFLLICVTGLLLTLLTQPYARLSRLVALASLGGALAAALLMRPNDSATLGEVQLATTWFGGFFLSALAASSLLLCIVGLLTGWPERLAPAALATMAGVGVAISSTDPTVALAAAAAATAPAALIASRVRSTPLGTTVGVAELRTLALVVSASLLAAVTILNTNWNSDDPTFVLALAFLVVAAAVAVRSGAVPFHVPAALLSRSGEGLGLVLSLVWIPTGLGLVALSWNASIFGVPGDWLDRAVVAVQVVAVATLVLGAVGAMLHDEIEEIVVYSIVQDAGFILLALTARSADAAQPARLWLLAFVIAKSALVAWAATASWAFETSSLGDLRGWLRRSPILGLALVAIVAATLGWPGSPVFEARGTLVRLGLPDSLHFLGTAAILLSLAYYVRLLAVGLLTPTEMVRRAGGDWPRWPRLPKVEDEEVEDEEVENEEVEAAAPPAVAVPINQAELGAKRSTARGDGRMPHRRPHFSIRHRLAVAWRLNRPLQASLLVLATATIAAIVAFGGFGASDASQSGITLDQAAAALPNPGGLDNGDQPTAEPSAQPSVGPTLQLVPSPAPVASPAPSASAGASPTTTAGE